MNPSCVCLPPQASQAAAVARRAVRALAAFGLAIAAAFPATASEADSFPNKPVKLVVPYATGGVSDTIGRIIAQGLTQTLGQTVYVENRGGAGGTVGAAVVAKSPADGYTLMLSSTAMIGLAPVVLGNLPYDTANDFSLIGTFITTPNILSVYPGLPVKNMAELAAYGKGAGKGTLSFGSAGPGSTGHLLGHIISTSMNVDMVQVPYKSSGQAFPDVVSGRLSMVFDSVPSTVGYAKAGHVRPIAVLSDKRSSVLPDVPTSAEEGFPNAQLAFWMGLEGPAKMPAAVVAKLNKAMRDAVALPETRNALATAGAEIACTSPTEFAALRSKDIVSLRKLALSMGLQPQ
jgi:tripartite-type tricarboxylate transporter receptor subunit TctC